MSIHKMNSTVERRALGRPRALTPGNSAPGSIVEKQLRFLGLGLVFLAAWLSLVGAPPADAASNKSNTASQTLNMLSPKRAFVTFDVFDGNLEGVAGA